MEQNPIYHFVSHLQLLDPEGLHRVQADQGPCFLNPQMRNSICHEIHGFGAAEMASRSFVL